MDVVSALAGAMTALMGFGALALGTHRRLRNWIKGIVREVFIEVGVTRYVRPGEEQENTWPNGWSNLPDALEGLARRLDDHLKAHAPTFEDR